MRKQQLWIQQLLEKAERNGHLLASQYLSDLKADMHLSTAAHLSRKGLITYAGKDDEGREIWVLKD